jgi:hypothetical protein
MRNNQTGIPQATVKPRKYLIAAVLLITLIGLAIVTFINSMQHLAKMPPPISQSFISTPTPTPTPNPTRYIDFLHTKTGPPPRPYSTFPRAPKLNQPPKMIRNCVYYMNRNGNMVGGCGYICVANCNNPVAAIMPPATETSTRTPTPTATFTPTATATFTPTATATFTPTPFISPVYMAGGSVFVLLVCLVILVGIIIRLARGRARNKVYQDK